MRKVFVSAIFFASLLFTIHSNIESYAYTFYMDAFYVEKNGSQFFLDQFDDGSPPALPTYSLTGSFLESGGKLELNSLYATTLINPLGQTFYSTAATLLSNVDNANLVNGLKVNDTLSVIGVFDYALPGPGESYWINLNDTTMSPFNGSDVLLLRVHRNASDQMQLIYMDADYISNTSTIVASANLDSSHDQIALKLSKDDSGSKAITASYAYIDGSFSYDWGTLAWNILPNTAEIFDSDNFTQARFGGQYNPSPVPEPATMLLLGSGLAGLAAFRKKFRKG